MNIDGDCIDTFESLSRKSLLQLRQGNHDLRAEVNAQERRIDLQEVILERLLREIGNETK